MGLLKRLELQGFKSFAGKTVLEFPARVVGIVGPNGSGKSNVIDAFRWVLGEREAKQLRGDTLENLIFAGTPKRAAVGFAKVGLCFDNRDGLLPLDAQEVVLERKIDRSGVSHYYLNDEEVRLKDLVPILARAKLGTRGLTMIGQGQSDVFVQSSPEERREMIEEILGLKEFRIKKAQAERRLFSSRINMEKVGAMIEELLPHLRLLRRQKHRWDKRGELAAELDATENEYYASQYRALAARAGAALAPLTGLEEERAKEEREIAALEAKMKAADAAAGTGGRAKEVRAGIAERFEKRAAAQAALARIEVKIEMLSRERQAATYNAKEAVETLRSFERDIPAMLAEGEIGKVRDVLSGWLDRLRKFFKEEKKGGEADFSEEQRRARDAVAALDREIGELRKEEERIASSEEERNREFRRQIEFLEEKKNRVRRLDQDIQNKRFEHEKVAMRRDEIANEWRGLGKQASALEALVPKTAHGEEELFEMQRRMARLRGELAAIGEIDEALVTEADESETRYAFLTKEIEDLDRAIADLKALVKELEGKIAGEFREAFKRINEEFNEYFRLMFGGGRAHLKLTKKPKPAPAAGGEDENGGALAAEIEREVEEEEGGAGTGIEVELTLPKKRITSLDMLSGGEKSLVSLAALFALIAVSPPPFLVLDEVDAPLDESNARRFAELVKNFSAKTQFLMVTHNRATMEAADVLYGITMGDDGVSKVLSMKMEE